MNLQSILLMFEAASGLKVNLQKTKLMVVGLVLNQAGLASILECQVLELLGTYLGMLLGA